MDELDVYDRNPCRMKGRGTHGNSVVSAQTRSYGGCVYDEHVRGLADPERRESCAATLREELPDSCDALVRGLLEGSASVRRSCAGILDHAPHDERVEQALRLAAKDADWRVRKAALHSLSCAPCKPDGCLTADGAPILAKAMLEDPDSRVRRMCSGAMMWGQTGHSESVTDAFRFVLDNSVSRVMRERAATYLASLDVPRDSSRYREWAPAWRARIAELLG